jgi:hypothetical protein
MFGVRRPYIAEPSAEPATVQQTRNSQPFVNTRRASHFLVPAPAAADTPTGYAQAAWPQPAWQGTRLEPSTAFHRKLEKFGDSRVHARDPPPA